MREQFEAALKENPFDRTTRLVFSDWLEEHGHDDEAAEQRRKATPEWCESYQWMVDLAKKAGTHCETYGESTKKYKEWRRQHNGEYPPSELISEWDGERPITVGDLIDGAAIYVDSQGNDWFVQTGDENLRDMWGHEIDPETFWKHWRMVTVRPDATTNYDTDWHSGSPFSCSC